MHFCTPYESGCSVSNAHQRSSPIMWDLWHVSFYQYVQVFRSRGIPVTVTIPGLEGDNLLKCTPATLTANCLRSSQCRGGQNKILDSKGPKEAKDASLVERLNLPRNIRIQRVCCLVDSSRIFNKTLRM